MRGYVPIWSLSSNFPRAAALTENALLCCLASMFKLLHKHWEEDVNLSFHKKSNFDLKDIVTNVVDRVHFLSSWSVHTAMNTLWCVNG